VAAGKVGAKLNVFLSAWRLSVAQRKALLAHTAGATNVWCYAPGYLDDDRPSLPAMRELTGFTFAEVAPPTAIATPTEAGKRLGLVAAFGVNSAVKPLFAVTDATPSEILATYPDGSAAVALRRGLTGASLFVGAPGLTSELLRLAAKVAGVHLYTQTDCNVYANGPFIALHAAQDGEIALDTGRPGKVSNLLSGEALGVGPNLRLDLRKGETLVLKAGN
jgi:hypothetical protein